MITTKRLRSPVNSSIWPGFVDAMAGLLLVLIFVLSIFMIVQFALREALITREGIIASKDASLKEREKILSEQDKQLADLTNKITQITNTLTVERTRADELEMILGTERLNAETLLQKTKQQKRTISDLQLQVETISSQNVKTNKTLSESIAENMRLLGANAALLEELATTRNDLKSSERESGLLRARNETLGSTLQEERTEKTNQIKSLQATLSQTDAKLLREASQAQDLLAQLNATKNQLNNAQNKTQTEAARSQNLLTKLREMENQLSIIEEARRNERRDMERMQIRLNETAIALATLEDIIAESESNKKETKTQIDRLSGDLNIALARIAREKTKRAQAEEALRLKLEAEAKELRNFRSEFFGQMGQILSGRQGVHVTGDRFIFDSEILFDSGKAFISAQGKNQISAVAKILREISTLIPPEIDWVIRIDGHTDDNPIINTVSAYANNWELSQARSLAVLEYMIDEEDMPPNRLVAAGFGEFSPRDRSGTEESKRRNRRIELKLTER